MDATLEAPHELDPPLFARAWQNDGRFTELLVDPQDERSVGLDGEVAFEVQAPGGREQSGAFEVRSGTSGKDLYRSLVRLFGSDVEPRTLWYVTPDLGGAREILRDGAPVSDASIWDDERRSDAGDPRLPKVLPDGLAFGIGEGITPSTSGSPFYLEVNANGRPIFFVARRHDRLVFDPVRSLDGRLEIVPRVISPLGLHTAFWGFAKCGATSAAMFVASAMLERLKRHQDPAPDLPIASAHAIMSFRNLWRDASTVDDALSKHEETSVDALILRWVIRYELGADARHFTERFPEILRVVKVTRPVYSATLRLLWERMFTGLDMAGTLKANGLEEIRGGVAFLDLLARSTFWGSEHLGYCAHAPNAPDPKATTAPDAKKKV